MPLAAGVPEAEPLQHARRDGLHLYVGHLLAEAHPRPRVEHRVLERALRPERALLVEPPLRPELLAVLAPHALQPRHGERAVRHQPPFPDERAVREEVVLLAAVRVGGHRRVQPHRLRDGRVEVVHLAQLVQAGSRRCAAARRAHRADLAQDLVLHVGPRGHQPEEPGQRGRGRVAAGEDEVGDHVAEALVVVLAGRGEAR
ncbi:hypothetical protein VPH35_045848 [Triticum aestivum]